jgi:AcrR family transcriptional regulator
VATARAHTEQGRERKEQLLNAAQDLFAARGFGNTRIADICAAAGVAKGLFYWYFPTKESVIVELVRDTRQRLRRAQGAAMESATDPLARIRLGAEASIRFIAEHRAHFALLDVERHDQAIAPVVREGSDVYVRDVTALIREAQRAGLVAPAGDPAVLAVGVVGAVSAYSHALRTGRIDLPVDELATLVGAWVTNALAGASSSHVIT